MSRLKPLLAAFALLAPLASPDVSAEQGALAEPELPETIPAVERIAGPDRISTATALSRSTYEAADTVVLARTDDYADALAGSPLARALGAPILLSDPTHIPAATEQELRRLQARSVVLLGGVQALGRGVEEDALALGLQARRIGGSSRFDTAKLIAQALAAEVGPPDCAYLAQGADADPSRGWPDALAVSALAAAQARPLLLTLKDGLPASTVDAITEAGLGCMVVVGGSAAIGQDVIDQLRAEGVDPRRVAGSTRFETATKIADLAVASGIDSDTVYLATGLNFPDGLAAAPTVAMTGGVLLLVGRDAHPSQPAIEWLNHREPASRIRILGGEQAVSLEMQALVSTLQDPRAADPGPIDPAPADPEPESLDPTDPAPEDPDPAAPEPVDPEPEDPAPDTPEPEEPPPAGPEPDDPAPDDPGPENPEPTVDPDPDHPGPETTGPRVADSELESSGGLAVTDDGAVVEGLDIAGTLVIDANDVVVRDTRVRSSAAYPIRAMPGTSGTVIEHVEVDGQYSLTNNSCISGSMIAVRRSELHRCIDGAKLGSGSVYEGNWIHDPTRDTSGSGSDGHGAHVDGLQSTGGSGIVIRGNHIDVVAADGHPSNSAIILKSDFGAIADCLIEDNWLNGGNYTVYLREGAHGPPTGCTVRDNRFGRDYRYGLLSIDGSVELSGNVWDDDGSSI